MENLLKYFLSVLVASGLIFQSCDQIDAFYERPSEEEIVALANSKYESLNDSNFYKNHTPLENTKRYFETLDEVKKLNPKHERVWIELADAYAAKGMAKEWKEHFDKALFLNMDIYQGWRGFHLLYKFRDYEKALADFEVMKLKNPNGPDYIYQTNINLFIGICYMQLKKYDEAIHAFDDFLKEEIELISEPFIDENGYLFKGIVLNRIKSFSSALEVFNQGIKHNPKLSDFHFHRAYALFHLKKYDEAKISVNKALELLDDGFKNQRYNGEEFEELFYEDVINLKSSIENRKMLWSYE